MYSFIFKRYVMNVFVATRKSLNKEKQINFRVSEDIKSDLEATAEFRGLSVSSWLHFLIVQANYAAKAEDLPRFQQIFRTQEIERKAVEATRQNNKQTIGVLSEGAGANDGKKKNDK